MCITLSSYTTLKEINHRHSLPLLLSFPGQMQILNENGMKNGGEQDQVLCKWYRSIDFQRVWLFCCHSSLLQECNDEQKKDLRSRGLCLVPVAFMMHVGSGNGADLWAPALGGGFRWGLRLVALPALGTAGWQGIIGCHSAEREDWSLMMLWIAISQMAETCLFYRFSRRSAMIVSLLQCDLSAVSWNVAIRVSI